MSRPDLKADLEALGLLTRRALADRWQSVFGNPAPAGCHAALMRAALGWHLQASASRPNASWEQLLRAQRAVPSKGALSPDTCLVREWQGRTHRVTVTPSGFEYDGTAFKSLSAVARKITGTAWSGPVFFGLR